MGRGYLVTVGKAIVKIGFFPLIQVHQHQVTHPGLRGALLKILGTSFTLIPHLEGAAESHIPIASPRDPRSTHTLPSSRRHRSIRTTFGPHLGTAKCPLKPSASPQPLNTISFKLATTRSFIHSLTCSLSKCLFGADCVCARQRS